MFGMKMNRFWHFGSCALLICLLAGAGWGQLSQDTEQPTDTGSSGERSRSTAAAAQQRGPTQVASADTIIDALQADPQLLQEVKEMAADQLRARGVEADASQITDEALFDRIRQDSSLRAQLTPVLLQRGAISRDQLAASGDSNESDLNPFDASAQQDETTPETPRLQRRTTPGPQTGAARQPQTPTRRQDQEPTDDLSGRTRSVPSPYSEIPALNDLYKQLRRDDRKLERFGADLFRNAQSADTSQMDLPAGSDYVLGPGDNVTIVLYGGFSQTLRRIVDREGRIGLPDVGAVMVAGKNLTQAQEIIEKTLATQFRNTKADLSLTRLRSIRVYVVGDVQRPGAYDISSLSTPLNALIAAGGPTTHGSYRVVRHLRGSQLVAEIDLYDFMLRGIRSDSERLRSGDTILVPPVRPQVTVSGMVRRPAVYELHDEQSLDDVLKLAGGVLVTGALRQINIERVEAHEKRTMISVPVKSSDPQGIEADLKNFKVQDGDHVRIASILPYSDQVVYLQGHVARPGKFSYQPGMKITDLIHSYEELLPEPSDHAEVIRLAPPNFRPVTIEFNLGNALAGDEKLELKPFDTVRIYGRYEVDAPKVSIFGAVLRPGDYPLASGMSAADLVRLAGGFKRSAETDTAELSSYDLSGDKVNVAHQTIDIGKAVTGDPQSDLKLKAGDVLTVHQIEGWNEIGASVRIAGEVGYPGTYGIQQGEKLSSLIRRVGGFRSAAYPAGAVLERAQVRELDNKSRQTLIRRIESSQPNVKSPEGLALTGAFVQQQQMMLQRLKSQPPNGRMVVKVSNDLSKWSNTPADIELRAGDTIFIPKRPGFVLVNGQVNNPSAVTFAPGKNAGWYLQRAGGTTEFGNRKGIFVIRADGSVVGAKGASSWFSGNVLSTVMQPGDTVVVPERIITESLFWKNVLNTAQITSSLAIAARVATSF
jgi:protein involved in polysaccharide export with SLBB domain